MSNLKAALVAMGLFCVTPLFAQDGNLVPPAEGQTVKTVLADIQVKVNAVQTMKASLEFDEKDGDSNKKKKKKKNKDQPKKPAVNPEWPEPEGRDVERGPIIIKRGTGAYLMLERKKDKAEYIANGTHIWKYDHKDKEARHIPSTWPIIDNFVNHALIMNVFVAMEPNTVKFRGVESVDGEPCWVLEGKSPSKLSLVGTKQVKLKMWIGQADGLPRIIRVPGEDDVIIRLKNMVINQPVDETKFRFSPPAGVKTKNIFGF